MNSRINVNVAIDMDFVFGASEHKYDLVYNPDDYSSNGLYKVLSVTLENGTETKRIAMIGDYHARSGGQFLISHLISACTVP